MSFLDHLSDSQRVAVQEVNGPVMIVAGAGSGKTRVLTYRIAHLIQCGVPPYEILALTFTNKAADEMKSRIRTLVGDKAADLWMGTFHSIFARVLRREAKSIGYTTSYTIYDSEDSLGVVKRIMGRKGISLQQLNPHAVRARISAAKNQLFTPSDLAANAMDWTDERIAAVFADYDQYLSRNNAMDFDDLLIKPIGLFNDHPAVLEKYQHRFKFILVDEFQDTNRAQYGVTRLLAGKFRNICVVGDDAQSIYAFRGADIRNILDFARDYPDCKTFRLEQNYRSTKTILGAADRLINHNVDRLKKELWTANPDGDEIVRMVCVDDRDEGLRVAQAVQQEIRAEGRDLKDFAILYRTNAQSRSLEDALRRSGIPYEIVGGIKFYERKEIKDVIAYLRLLVNPRDDESALRVLNYPLRGIGDVSEKRIIGLARENGRSVVESLKQAEKDEGINDRARRGIRDFRKLIEKFSRLRSSVSPNELSRALVDELGILRQFKEEGTPESMARWENVQELLSALSEFTDTKKEATVEQFLEEVSLVSDIDSWEVEKNAVTLMTLHSSKGLEFPVVLITGLEEGLLPFYSSSLERGELEEERRLLYVGMTRAKQKLYLSHTRLRYRFGEPSYQSESRFLSEIGSDAMLVAESRARGLNGYDDTRRRVTGGVRKTSGRREESTAAGGFVSDPMPDYEDESQELVEIKRGSLVQHEVFGRGKVLQITGGGDMRKASVKFEEHGVKNLVLKFARLRPG